MLSSFSQQSKGSGPRLRPAGPRPGPAVTEEHQRSGPHGSCGLFGGPARHLEHRTRLQGRSQDRRRSHGLWAVVPAKTVPEPRRYFARERRQEGEGARLRLMSLLGLCFIIRKLSTKLALLTLSENYWMKDVKETRAEIHSLF